jgi:type IV pilus assembly protein PilF
MKIRWFHASLILLLLLVSAGCAGRRDPGVQEINKNPAAYHYQMGLSYLGERNYTSALFELTEAEKYDPENPELLYNLGMAYVGKKRPDLAEQKLLAAIKLKPSYSKARNDLGVAYIQLKRWDKAIEQFKIVKDDLFYDNSENATINLGLSYLGKGEYQKAMDELRTVAEINPRNPIIRLSIGRVWFAMEKTELAIAEYQKAIQIYKDYGAAYYYLGLAQLKLNNKDEARKAFKEVLRIFPESDLGHLSVGYLEQLK